MVYLVTDSYKAINYQFHLKQNILQTGKMGGEDLMQKRIRFSKKDFP